MYETNQQRILIFQTSWFSSTGMQKLGTPCSIRYIGISLLFIGLSFIDHADSMDIRVMLTANGFDAGNQFHFYLETFIDSYKTGIFSQPYFCAKHQICRMF